MSIGASDSSLTAEQRAVRDTVRSVARTQIRPGAREADATGSFPEDVWEALADLDLAGATVPEQYGGVGADRLTCALVSEGVAYGSLAVATALSVHWLAASCIAELGDDHQRERWLPEMAAGRPVGMFALSEPGAGSNPAEMETVARRDGDEYVITGRKQWITNGRRGGVCVLFAKTDPDDESSVTAFLLPKDLPGVTVGAPEEKLGLRASDTTPLLLDEVRLSATARLTEEGRGLAAALEILTGGRVNIAAQAVGLGDAALEAAREYATQREQFGRSIAEFQTIRHKLAEMATQVHAGRTLAYDAARRLDAGEDARTAASMAKYFASEAAVDVCNQAVQIHGGYGYTTEFDVERFYRDAKVTTIYEGTSEIQKDVIARGILE